MNQQTKKPAGDSGSAAGYRDQTSDARSLPYYDEYEKNILGCILGDEKLIDHIELVPEDFYFSKHLVIFKSMLEMKGKGIPIDELTLYEELKSKGLEEDAGGFAYLGYLRGIAISAANISYHVEKVKEASQKSKLWEKGQRLIQAIESNAGEEVINKLQSEIGSTLTIGDLLLKPVPAKELENTEAVESQWGDMFYPNGISQMNAEPGVGKTTFLYNLCLHGTQRQAFLGVNFSKKLKVLYVDIETPKWKRASKLKAICDGELPESLYFLDSLDLKADFPHLLSLCHKERYDLLVFDTQSRIFGMEQENDNSEANYIMTLLRRLTNETGCSIVLVHHTTKTDDSRKVYRGRGASAIAGAVDVVVNMEALDDEIIKLTVAKNRIVGTNPVLYLKKVGEDRFEIYNPPDGSSGFEIFKAQDFILSLSPNKNWQTSEICELGERQGFNRRTIERALKRLVEAGKFQKVKYGVYQFRQTDNSDKYRDGGTVGMAETKDESFPEVIT